MRQVGESRLPREVRCARGEQGKAGALPGLANPSRRVRAGRHVVGAAGVALADNLGDKYPEAVAPIGRGPRPAQFCALVEST